MLTQDELLAENENLKAAMRRALAIIGKANQDAESELEGALREPHLKPCCRSNVMMGFRGDEIPGGLIPQIKATAYQAGCLVCHRKGEWCETSEAAMQSFRKAK